MALLEKQGHDTPPPERWAVWRVHPEKYDPHAADGAKGGALFECLQSPPMLACDHAGHCYVPQDAADTLMRIDAAEGRCEQLAAPFPLASPPVARTTGPSIRTDPMGGVWYCLLGCNACLVRLDPSTGQQTLHQLGSPAWAPKLCFIHLDMATDSALGHRIYALTSDLLHDAVVNALVVLELSDDWSLITRKRVLPLPTQDCACHRVVYLGEELGISSELASVVISELASSKLLQVQVRHLTSMERLAVSWEGPDERGHLRATYETLEDEMGDAC